MAIIETFVRHLIEDKHSALVATYVATLPQELQIEWYAKFLEGMWYNVMLLGITRIVLIIKCGCTDATTRD